MSCDLLVAGGGSAGLAAAVAGARSGARTLLVERHGALGGMATAALVHSICGLYELAGEGDPVWANPGFASEFARRLLASGGATGPVRMGRVHVLPHQPAAFARLADEIVAGTPNLEVLLHTEIIAAAASPAAVELSTRGIRRVVNPRALVDATGDGALAAMVGADFEQAAPERLQRPAFIFGLHGVDPAGLDDDGRLRVASQIALAVRDGVLPGGAIGAAIRGTGRGGEAYVTIDLAGPPDYDPQDAAGLTALEVEGRALAWRLAEFFRTQVSGFSASAISAFPARVGIRESRRVVGCYRLETADLEHGRQFPDVIARATWPMEMRESNRGARLRYPVDGRAADIPLRSLRARDHGSVFVAGRCLSCSHEVQASVRVMGTCLATGEAAGIAAALFADGLPCDAAAVTSTRERFFETMNIVEKIFAQADRVAVAVIHNDEGISYGRLIGMVDAAAGPIEASGAARVGLSCPNGLAHIVLALAIVRAGKCLVPIADELCPREREEVIRRTAVGAIVNGDGAVRDVSPPGEIAFDEAKLAALNPAFIRFSSGTTSRSKGIVISHETLLERVTAANRGLQISPRDRVVWILPMAHHFAVSIMLYLLHGATTVIVTSHLAEDVLAAARRHGGTVLYGAPFHHALLAAEASGDPWPTLRLAVSTAAALPPATAQAFEARYGVPLSQGLGIIEVGLPILNLTAGREKPESIGRPLPDFEAEVRADELFLRGPGMLDAYLDPWRTRAEIMEDGWFRTGDMARIDDEGCLYLTGRSSSVINVAGMKCFPEEVEAVLCEHPGIRAARVSGRPHPKAGAVPVAELIASDPSALPSIAAVATHCRGALARYKIPLEFRFVEAIPLTPSGKIKRT